MYKHKIFTNSLQSNFAFSTWLSSRPWEPAEQTIYFSPKLDPQAMIKLIQAAVTINTVLLSWAITWTLFKGEFFWAVLAKATQ